MVKYKVIQDPAVSSDNTWDDNNEVLTLVNIEDNTEKINCVELEDHYTKELEFQAKINAKVIAN